VLGKQIFTQWGWTVIHPENLTIGEDVDIGTFTLLAAHKGITIFSGVKIGSHCAIYTKSTIDDKEGTVVIDNNAKVGSHCTIMPGVVINFNAIVAAHSFVNCDIPSGEMWGGVPARRIK